MRNPNTIRIFLPLREAFKNSALAIALASWMAAGTALAAPPANDDFVNAINLTGIGPNQTGDMLIGTQTGTNTTDSTLEVGEPNPGAANTVWFKWTSPVNGGLTVSTAGSTSFAPSEWDAILGIYTGSAVNALIGLGTTPQDIVLEESMTVAVTAGTTYSIQLAGFGAEAAANILVSWRLVPTNGATILTFGPGAAVGTIVSNAANINWNVPFGTPTAPTFTLSPGATCTVAGIPISSGTLVNFSGGPVVYTVTAQGASPIINNYTVTAAFPTPVLWNLAGSGTWDNTTPNWLTQPGAVITTFATSNEAIFNNAAGGTITIAPGISPGFTTVNAAAGTYIFEGGPITGSGPLTKSGGGTLILTGANTYSGKTTVNSGMLEASNNTTVGGSTSFSVANGATLLLSGTTSAGYKWPATAATLTGAGTVRRSLGSQANTGLNFDMSAFTGVLEISGGQLAANPFYSPSFVSPPNGTIRVGANTQLYLGWQGTTFNTTVELNAGTDNGETLGVLRGDTATLNGAVILKTNSTIGSAGGTFTLNSVISDEGNGLGFAKDGGGIVVITGTNTYKGATIVNNGRLVCKNVASLGNGGALIIPNSAVVELDYLGDHVVSSLTIAGVDKDPGVYGSSSSGAPVANQDNAHFAGTGTVTVPVVSGYTSWATTNGVTGGVNGDSNKDGVQNGIAYFMNNTGLLTSPGFIGNMVTWPNGGNLPSTEYGAAKQFVVETSPNLTIWTPVDAGSLTTNTSGPGGTLSYTLVPAGPKLFVRLRMNLTP